ncbi:fibronectin type III and SPRY domain-containing protein 2 isoform X1 [Octodon degus]|uniref:Fibronectin type III and SPRY domain-containing protein 2 isoform X1 n=1 Tax=Octodon degus TaxID=10160 RepID=A0A6P6E2H8_OCTDE|nr:fibronectin type III and SPRY domain-containing protein 2 isoform X1 [Octodon degus]XP_023566514.1 fibronectin type III and SPRY domain-containing protein 2 isoform X1 [Octodon degus]
MEEESGEEPGQVRSTAPKDFHYYHMDLYDAEDRPQIFPDESTRLKRETIQAEMTLEPRQARQSQVQRDLPEEVDELVHLYGLEDDHELGDEFVDEDEVGVPAYPPYGMKRGESAREQRDWRLGGEAEAEDQGYAGWGMAGQSQALREAYRYTHGCASEEYECYVIPEEEDEEEDAGLFCVTCRTPVRAVEKDFDEHKEHEVTPLNKALESAKDEIHKNMYKLEQQIIEMENFASHLEEVFITVEENFGKQEQNFESHYNEILETLAQKYEEKIQALGEKKKEKLEALYGQLVSCGENLDTCKELMETIEEMCHEEKVDFLKDAVAMTDRLGKFLKTKTDVEISAQPDFEDQTLDFSDVEQLMGSMNTIPAPCAPVINPQAPNSATGSSVRVCWSLYADDTVESYQLFYRPVRDSLPGKEQAELTVTVKETYCSVMNLEPNTQYEFWVIAQNRAGPSPSSERAVYMTAPSAPIIKMEAIRSCEEAVLICWESGNLNPVDSYTVELTQAEAPAASGVTESVVGIPTCESLIQLQPGQSYTICVRALNMGGPSARSAPATVRTTGSYFPLNKATCHPWLTISEDGFTVTRSEKKSLTRDLLPHQTRFTRCVAVMGNLIPVRGRHYWEVEVDEHLDYTVGVAFEDVPKQEDLGANSLSWCMRHTFTSSRHKYEFLHNRTTPDIRISVPPKKIGVLLDYENSKLSFFNVDIAQHLYTFSCQLHQLVHPCFSLEKPGCLKIHNGVSMPTHATFY